MFKYIRVPNSLLFGIFLLMGGFLACGEQAPKCPFNKPVPIFGQEIQGVKNYAYESKEYDSREVLSLDDLNLDLEILQRGCEKVEQEYRIRLRGTINDVKNAPQCADLLAQLFNDFAQLSPEKLRGCAELAAAIGNNVHLFEYGEKVAITTQSEQVIHMEINRMNEAKTTLLTLVLYLN